MYRILILPVLLLALAGCVTTQQNPGPVTDESHQHWSLRQQQLAQIDNWEIRGRVALFVDDDVYNLGLNWTLEKNHSTLKLEAAMGQGVIQLENNNTEVILQTSEGDSYYGQNAEQVLKQSTGWSIPVEGLESWIKGINHNQSDYLPEIDSTGKARSLMQDEWRINYLQYATASLEKYNNPELPRKIYMKRQNLALKIVIDQWQAQKKTSTSELFPVFDN